MLLRAQLFAFLLCIPAVAHGQDWPVYRHDGARSGFVTTVIDAPRLEQEWMWSSELPPEPAWDGPARWDAYNAIRDLPAMRQYDACFHPVSDGEKVYLGSSSQDTLFALNLKDGRPAWTYIAGGPIRLAPTIFEETVLFGCDDGYAYCLNRQNGKLIWRFNPSESQKPGQRMVVNNDRLVSFLPIRSGVTIRDGIAYFGASFLPWNESYVCAVSARTGKLDEPERTFVTRHEDVTLEGSLLVAGHRLIVPQGRVAPIMFDRRNGKSLGQLPGGGGITIVISEEGDVIRTEGGSAARAGQVGVFKGNERVASFPRGRSIVVRQDSYFVLDGQKLFAASRENNELKWQIEFDEPLEIIMADDVIFVGGKDSVVAVDSRNGKVVWKENVNGRAFGLAVANKKLVVSTDSGAVYSFAATSSTDWTDQRTEQEQTVRQSPIVPDLDDKNLLHRWVFHRSAMVDKNGAIPRLDEIANVKVNDQISQSLPLILTGTAKSIGLDDSLEGIELGGGYFPNDDQAALAKLPKGPFSVEAWARIDEAAKWGGIVGCIRDNGSTEHGWLLGYCDDKFCFAVAGATSGLTYMTDQNRFKLGKWHHLVGTYDGQNMKLFVDGKLAATSKAENGLVNYAKKRIFTVGAYRDDNELYPLKGAIHEINIYDTVKTEAEIQTSFKAKNDRMPITKDSETAAASRLAWGPVVRYLGNDQAEIRFATNTKTQCFVSSESPIKTGTPESNPSKTHAITISNLPYRRSVTIQINATSESEPLSVFEIDTHFNWGLPQIENGSSTLANTISAHCKNDRGIVVVQSDDESVALELSKQKFSVIQLVSSFEMAQRLRQKVAADERLQYGQRLTIIDLSIERLPTAMAAAVISAVDDSSVRRVVRPNGLLLNMTGEVVWNRGELRGAGNWSHMYGSADNSAFGGETLSSATNREDLVTQWIGRPGPRYQTDRQNRKASPLAVGGRLYLQGQQRLISLDSFSGSVLWSLETPSVMRWNVPHDCANWCADEDGVFVAAERNVWYIGGGSGEIETVFDIPDNETQNQSWGYVGRYKNQLIGSAVRPEAIYTKWWGKSQWFDSTAGDDTHVVASENLFSLNLKSKTPVWKYSGLVLNPTISIVNNTICFVEDVTPSHLQAGSHRVSLDNGQQYKLVCLDVESGKKIWEKSLPEFEGHVSSLYLAAGGDEELQKLILVASEATKKHFHVQAFAPKTGELVWKRDVAWEANHHGKHISRPAIQGDLMYLRPEVLQLVDGETLTRGFPGGHGCSSYSLCTNGLFSRLGETTWWDARSSKVNRFERIRTDCWISVIPAQGMLLSAEGGGGCSCGTWLETTLGFIPKAVDYEHQLDAKEAK